MFHQQGFYRWTTHVFSFRRFEFHFSVGFSWGIFLESSFIIWRINSFQKLAISTFCSRFLRMFGQMLFLGFIQSNKISSLIFLVLHCGSKSRNTLFSQSIVCFYFSLNVVQNHLCLACKHLIAYSFWYLWEVTICVLLASIYNQGNTWDFSCHCDVLIRLVCIQNIPQCMVHGGYSRHCFFSVHALHLYFLIFLTTVYNVKWEL